LSTESQFDAQALIEQLTALGLHACVDEDGQISVANKHFLAATNSEPAALINRGLNDFEATARAQQLRRWRRLSLLGSQGRSLAAPQAHAPMRRHCAAAGCHGQWRCSASWCAIDVRDRLMRDADIGMWR
jgi:hypothetical protein